MFTTDGFDTCEECGNVIYRESRHRQVCESASPFAGAETCPMCGEEFDRFLGHLQRCEGGEG